MMDVCRLSIRLQRYVSGGTQGCEGIITIVTELSLTRFVLVQLCHAGASQLNVMRRSQENELSTKETAFNADSMYQLLKLHEDKNIKKKN